MANAGVSARVAQQIVKPLISSSNAEARRRVLRLYKAWYRQIPFVMLEYDIPVTEQAARAKLREKFEEKRNVTDMRVIDMLVIKGQQDLVETANIWKQKNHIMDYFKPTVNKKPNDFLSKFYESNAS